MKGDSIPIYRTPFRFDLWKWWIIHKINVFRMLEILYSYDEVYIFSFFCKEDRNMDSHCTCTFDSYTKHFLRQMLPLLVVFYHYVLCNLTGLWLWILRVGVQQSNAGTYGLAFTECSIPQYQIYCKNKHVKPMKINTYAIKFSLYQK